MLEGGGKVMQRILIIEDDSEISAMLSRFLEQNNFQVQSANNGIEGIKKAKTEGYDLVLLDLMLPYKSGDEILRELREISNVPVIVISAKTLTQTKIEVLKLGADDYITKPFDLNELLARVEANIRRHYADGYNNAINAKLCYGEIIMDTISKEVNLGNKRLNLTSKEYALLEIMLENPLKVFSKQSLYESVWNEQYAYDDNTINTHMSNLRKKIKMISNDEYIETIWGMGYKLKVINL